VRKDFLSSFFIFEIDVKIQFQNARSDLLLCLILSDENRRNKMTQGHYKYRQDNSM